MGERESAMEGVGGLMVEIKHKLKGKMWEELWIIATVIFSFMTAACINKWRMMGGHMAAYLITLFADIILISGWTWKICSGIFKWVRSRKKEVWVDKAGAGIVMVYCAAVRIVQLKDMPYWDGLVYYNMLRNACDKFDFTFTSFWENFIFAAHPTLAFAGVTAIGEFLRPNVYSGVLAVWLIVTLIADLCAYRIFQKLLPKSGFWYPVLAACVLMTTPSVLGTFSYYQPDMGLVCFFLFLVYSYLYHKNVLMFFFMLLLIMTKEVGIIAVGGFGIGILLGRILFRKKEETIRKSFFDFLKEPLGISGIVAFVMLLTYLIFLLASGRGIWSYKDSGFRIEPEFILFKAKQYFVLNFGWIVWGGNLLLYILNRRKKENREEVLEKDIVLSILGTAMAQMLFLMIYVTFALPRYHVLIDLCGVFVMLIQFGKTCNVKLYREKKNWKMAAVSVVGVLFLAEAYLTVDPLALGLMKKDNTGKSNVITENYKGGAWQAEYTVYNHHYSYLTRVYNQILKAVDYHDGMDVIVWSQRQNYGIMNGSYYWNDDAGKLSVKAEGNVPIRGYTQEEMEAEQILMQGEAVFIGIPQLGIEEESAEKFLTKHYEIRYKGNVSVGMAGEAFFYVCDLIK